MNNTIENWQAIKVAKNTVRKRSVLNGHKLAVCPTGRIRYRDRSQAQDAVVAMRRSFSKSKLSRFEVVAWACADCRGFHLLNKTRRDVEAVAR